MKTSLETYHGWHVIGLCGTLVLRNLADARRAIDAYTDHDGIKVMLDLSETTLVDSSGVSFIVNLSTRLKARNGQLVIVAPNPDTRLVFSIVGLTQQIALFDTRDKFEQLIIDTTVHQQEQS